MSITQRQCWRCDECGHEWLKGDKEPTHCASSKCRKRTWNKSGLVKFLAEMQPIPLLGSMDSVECIRSVRDAEETAERQVVYEEIA